MCVVSVFRHVIHNHINMHVHALCITFITTLSIHAYMCTCTYVYMYMYMNGAKDLLVQFGCYQHRSILG